MKVLRTIFCILLCWCAAELWARYRYDLQSLWLPMNLRANIAPTPLQAHRLVPNFHGVSPKGVEVATDAFGFRCMPQQAQPKADLNRLILAGDSVAFGMYLGFEDSMGHHLGLSLPHWQVMVQAVPGGSQGMTLDHLFGRDALAEASGARWIIHTVNHYDNTDNWLYAMDEAERESELTMTLRQAQSLLGPYWIQMLKVKLRAFLRKDTRRQLLFADERRQRDGATQRALNELISACHQQDMGLAMVFMPDRGELLSDGDPAAPLVDLCKNLGVPIFDLCSAMRHQSKVDLHEIFRDDRIHLSDRGSALAGELVAKWFKGLSH